MVNRMADWPVSEVSKKRVRMSSRNDGFNGDLHIARGSVFEPDGAGKTGRELAMHLALRRARANGSPAHQFGDVLRGNHVEEFGTGRNAHLGQVEQKMPRQPQAVIDAKRLVQMRIVDQSLPAEGGARFLKINTHDDEKIVREVGNRAL